MSKKLIIAIVAIVLAVAIPVTAFILLGGKKEPEKANYAAEYVALQSTALHDAINTLLSENFVSNLLNNVSAPTKLASSGNVDITLSQDILAMMGLENVSFADLGLPDSITAVVDSLADGFKESISVDFLINGQEVINSTLITDPLSGVVYMTFPTISNYWVTAGYADLEELPDASSIVNGLTEIAEFLPSLREPVNKYIDLALAQMKNVEKGSETVTVGSKSEKATVYTNYITEKVAVNIVKAVLTEAKTDSTIKSLLPAELNLEATIDMLLSSLPEDPSNDKNEALVLKLYQGQNGKIIGCSFNAADSAEVFYFAASDSTAAKLGFMASGQGFTLELAKDSAVLYGIQNNVSVKLGALTFVGDAENGSVALSISKTVTGSDADAAVSIKWATVGDTLTITLAFENGAQSTDLGYFIITGDENTGSFEMKFSNAIETALFGVPNVGFSISGNWDESDPTTDGNVIVSLLGRTLVTFRVYDHEDHTTTDRVIPPSNALEITDPYDAQAFVNSINLTTLRQNLLDAGFSAQLIDAIFAAMAD